MTIYRVYESYHDSSESGTYEYGYFSSLDVALARAKGVWAQKNYPKGYKVIDDGGLYAHTGWDSCLISISKIEVDQPINDNNCGYT